jgi:hypothetical protein
MQVILTNPGLKAQGDTFPLNPGFFFILRSAGLIENM